MVLKVGRVLVTSKGGGAGTGWHREARRDKKHCVEKHQLRKVVRGRATKRYLVKECGELGVNWEKRKLERGQEANPQSEERILSVGLRANRMWGEGRPKRDYRKQRRCDQIQTC